MRVTGFVSNEACALHDTGWNHPDHQGRLPALTRAVYRDLPALFEPLLQLEAPPAAPAELLGVHTRAYLDELRGTSIAAAAEGRTLELGGVPVSGASWDAALGAVGATLAAVALVLRGEVRNAFVPSRPPGRGARADRPGEHSLVNHVAVAARRLREQQGSARVLVAAWGGTPASALRELLAGDAGVTVISLHPAAAGADHPRDVPVDGDAAATVAALREALEGIPAAESPDFVLLSAGFELFSPAPDGGGLSPADAYPLTLALREWVDARAGGRLVSVLEGGWDAAALGTAVVQHLHALAGLGSA